MSLVDRWILERLDEVIGTCRFAYEKFEFHKVYHALNQFCAVDLSSLYVDITKDRMYCDAPDSPRRRGTQAAMREILDALCKLLAPVLVFTAEEAWRHSAVAASADAGQPGSSRPPGLQRQFMYRNFLRHRTVMPRQSIKLTSF